VTAAESSGALAALDVGRRQIAELLITAGALAFAVNLVSDRIGQTLGFWGALGGGLAVGLAVLVGVLFSRPRRRQAELSGYLLVAASRGRPVPIPRYEFAEELGRQLPFVLDNAPQVAERWESDIPGVLRDATEAYVLRKFSHALDATFPMVSGDKGFVDLERAELGSVVTDNPVLEFLTDPGVFNIQMPDLVMLMLPGGSIAFERIRIRLPEGSTIKREGAAVQVQTKKCTVRILVEADGTTVLEHDFTREFLGALDRTLRLDPHRLKVTVDVRFRLSAVLARRGLVYYRWVDTFIEQLDEAISHERFFSTIDWEGAMTLIDWFEGRIPQVTRKLSLGPVTSGHEAIRRAEEILRAERMPVRQIEDGVLLGVQTGSSAVYIDAAELSAGILLRLHAAVLQRVDGVTEADVAAVLDRLNTLNITRSFGRFVYRPLQRTILLEYELFAGEMEPAPFLNALRHVAALADDVDDDLQRTLGTGRRATEVLTSGRLDPDGTLVMEAEDAPEYWHRAMEQIAWDDHGTPALIELSAVDGGIAHVAVDKNGEPVQALITGQEGDAPVAAMAVLGREGFVLVAISPDGRPTASSEALDTTTRG
jgi:hypothetical protein